MCNFRKILYAILLTLFCTLAFSAEYRVLKLTTDESISKSGDYIYLVLEADDDNTLIAIHEDFYRKDDSFIKRVTPEISENIENDLVDGVLLYQAKGYDIIKLYSNNFSKKDGGAISVEYLYNALAGSKYSEDFELSYEQDSWYVLDRNGEKLTGLHCIGNVFFGQLIGIYELQLIH